MNHFVSMLKLTIISLADKANLNTFVIDFQLFPTKNEGKIDSTS